MLKYNQIFFIKRGDGKTQRNIPERILMVHDKVSNKKSVQMIFMSLSKCLHRNLIQILKIFSVLEMKIMTPLITTKLSTLLFD